MAADAIRRRFAEAGITPASPSLCERNAKPVAGLPGPWRPGLAQRSRRDQAYIGPISPRPMPRVRRNKIRGTRGSPTLLSRHEVGRRPPFRFPRLGIRAQAEWAKDLLMEINNFKDMYIAELQ